MSVIITPAGRHIEAAAEVATEGQVVYTVTFLTPDGEIPVGAFTLSPDSRPAPEPGWVSVHYGTGPTAKGSDRYQRTQIPLVGEDLYLVGRATVNPETVGDGSDLRVRLAATPASTESAGTQPGSEAALRAVDLVAALVRDFAGREDRAEIELAHAIAMAPTRLAEPLAQLAAIDDKIRALRIVRMDLSAKVDILSALVPTAENE